MGLHPIDQAGERRIGGPAASPGPEEIRAALVARLFQISRSPRAKSSANLCSRHRKRPRAARPDSGESSASSLKNQSAAAARRRPELKGKNPIRTCATRPGAVIEATDLPFRLEYYSQGDVKHGSIEGKKGRQL